MFTIIKRIEIAGSHCLELDYNSKCRNNHGHNWIVTVCCQAEKLNKNGMVIDFTHIKEFVNKLDHKNLNDILDFNPTAENIASFICHNISNCYKVEVQESEGNICIYEKNEKI